MQDKKFDGVIFIWLKINNLQIGGVIFAMRLN